MSEITTLTAEQAWEKFGILLVDSLTVAQSMALAAAQEARDIAIQNHWTNIASKLGAAGIAVSAVFAAYSSLENFEDADDTEAWALLQSSISAAAGVASGYVAGSVATTLATAFFVAAPAVGAVMAGVLIVGGGALAALYADAASTRVINWFEENLPISFTSNVDLPSQFDGHTLASLRADDADIFVSDGNAVALLHGSSTAQNAPYPRRISCGAIKTGTAKCGHPVEHTDANLGFGSLISEGARL